MSDLKTREFWVSDSGLDYIIKKPANGFNLEMISRLGGTFTNKITISFQNKPKTITITEDDFDEIFGKYAEFFTNKEIKRILFEDVK